jgi:hypothetical protein
MWGMEVKRAGTATAKMTDIFKSENRKKADIIGKDFAIQKKHLEEKQQHALDSNLSAKELALKEKEHLNDLINLEKDRRSFDISLHKKEIEGLKKQSKEWFTSEEEKKDIAKSIEEKEKTFKSAVDAKFNEEKAQAIKIEYDEKIKQQAEEHDTKIAKMIEEGKSDKDISKEKDKQVGAKVDLAVEADQATADAKAGKADKDRNKMLDRMSNSMSKLVAKAKDSSIFKFFKDNWGKILIGLTLLLAPMKTIIDVLKTVWKLVKSVFDFFFKDEATDEEKKAQDKEIVQLKKDEAAKLAKMEASGQYTEEQIAKARIESEKRISAAEEKRVEMNESGIFGRGGFLENWKIEGILTMLGIGLAALMFPLTALKLGFKTLMGAGKLLGKAFGAAKGSISKLFSKKIPKVPGTTALDKGLKKPPKWDKMSDVEQKKFNAAKAAKAPGGGAPKAGGAPGGGAPKPGGAPKLGGAPKVAKPAGIGSKLADKGKGMMKWASKFPKLAKSMKFLTKIPFIGKAFLVGPLIYALMSGAGKKTIAPLIGQIFGGIGGAALGSALGGLLGLAGGPLALVTAALGGIAGAMVGETLATAMAQWLVGEKVDAFPDSWYLPFGWINDLMNSGKGPKEPSGAAPGAAGGGEETAKAPGTPPTAAPGAPGGGAETAKPVPKPPTVKPIDVTTDGVEGITKAATKSLKNFRTARDKRKFSSGKNNVRKRFGKMIARQSPEYQSVIFGLMKDKEQKNVDREMGSDFAAMRGLTASGPSADLAAANPPEEKQQQFQESQQANLEGKTGTGQPVIVNAPVTNNNVSGGGGGTSFITPQKASHDELWQKTMGF